MLDQHQSLPRKGNPKIEQLIYFIHNIINFEKIKIEKRNKISKEFG